MSRTPLTAAIQTAFRFALLTIHLLHPVAYMGSFMVESGRILTPSPNAFVLAQSYYQEIGVFSLTNGDGYVSVYNLNVHEGQSTGEFLPIYDLTSPPHEHYRFIVQGYIGNCVYNETFPGDFSYWELIQANRVILWIMRSTISAPSFWTPTPVVATRTKFCFTTRTVRVQERTSNE